MKPGSFLKILIKRNGRQAVEIIGIGSNPPLSVDSANNLNRLSHGLCLINRRDDTGSSLVREGALERMLPFMGLAKRSADEWMRIEQRWRIRSDR